MRIKFYMDYFIHNNYCTCELPMTITLNIEI